MSELANLRRARTKAHMRLRRLEALAEAARERIAVVETAILKIAPDFPMTPSRPAPPRRFRKSEIVSVTLTALREAREPMGIRDIALLVLASKGIAPDRQAIESTL